MKSFLLIISAVLMAAACSTSKNAQEGETEKQIETKRLVDSREYVFRARSVLPLRGRMRQLTSEYDLRVSNDTVTAFLPYFGRAYTASMDPTQGGIRFVSTSFEYQSKSVAGGGWEITIKPGDNRSVSQMNLRIGADGYSTLQVISTNRDNISFNGYITGAAKR